MMGYASNQKPDCYLAAAGRFTGFVEYWRFAFGPTCGHLMGAAKQVFVRKWKPENSCAFLWTRQFGKITALGVCSPKRTQTIHKQSGHYR